MVLQIDKLLFMFAAGILVRRSVTAPGRLMFKPFQPVVWLLILSVLLYAIGKCMRSCRDVHMYDSYLSFSS